MRPRRSLTRIGLGTAAVLLVLAAGLGIVLLRRVDDECRAYTAERESGLAGHVRLGLAALETAEKAALDALQRIDPAADAARRVEDEHPIAESVFILRDGAIVWPRGPARGPALEPRLWREAADDPAARTYFARVDERSAAGDRDGAIAALRETPDRPLSPPAQAEAGLREAALLAEDPARTAEAVACLTRVIELGRNPEADEPAPPWSRAARLRRGTLLLERGDAAGGARDLLDVLESAVKGLERGDGPGLDSFYAERASTTLEAAEVEGRLGSSGAARFHASRATAARIRAELAMHAALEREILPRLLASKTEPGAMARLALPREGASDVFAWREEPGTGGKVGMREDSKTILETILGACGEGATIRGEDERFLAGTQAIPGNASSGGRIAVAVGGGFPWTVEAHAAGELASFRSRRMLLYGSALAGGLLLAAAAAWATLRGMSRELELARLKEEFVANVSHELKTPLTLIRMFTDLLRLGYTKGPEDAERSLEVISREADNLGFLIENVLAASRIEAGEAEYRPEPADLVALTRQVVDEYRPYAERKGFVVRLENASDPLPIEVDRLAFAQALRNLLANAVKYARERKEIEVSAFARNGTAAVEVADRGPGLGPGDPGRLFERFFRAPQAPGEAAAGAGLGLSIVDHMARGHGGEAGARAREGGGAVFTIRFPMKAKGA